MGRFGVIQKWCSILVRTHEILAGGRVPRFWSTYIHTHDRLDKLRSALADAQLKTHKVESKNVLRSVYTYRHCARQRMGSNDLCPGPGQGPGPMQKIYRPQTKLREGNVFTGLCLFTGRGVVPSCRTPGTVSPPGPYPPPPPRNHKSGRYASYWNVLFTLHLNRDQECRRENVVHTF